MTRYRIDIDAARRRLAAREHHTIQTPYGAVQYAERGQGPPVLFSHPLVGGFDVGLGCAEPWIGDGFRVIAPSRFGYLGSSLPQGAMPADQARRPTRPALSGSSGRPWSVSRPVGRR